MRHSLYVALAVFSTVITAATQDMPTEQFYIGYELERPNLSVVGVSLPRLSFNGLEISNTVRAYRWIGLETNFGVGYKDYSYFNYSPTSPCVYVGNCIGGGSTNLNFFGLAGPRVQYPFGRVEPYGHFLLGAEHVRWTALSSDGVAYTTNAFALGGGGGVVLHLTNHFGVSGGLDYVHAAKSIDGVPVASNTMRVTVGPVFTWGGRTSKHATDRSDLGLEQPLPRSALPQTALPLLGVVVDTRRCVIQFLPDSVLFNHGISLGDIITSLDDKVAKNPEDLTSFMSGLTKGTKVKVGFLVRGQWQTWMSVQL